MTFSFLNVEFVGGPWDGRPLEDKLQNIGDAMHVDCGEGMRSGEYVLTFRRKGSTCTEVCAVWREDKTL